MGFNNHIYRIKHSCRFWYWMDNKYLSQPTTNSDKNGVIKWLYLFNGEKGVEKEKEAKKAINMGERKTPFEELTDVSEISAEQILAELMNRKKKRFHTEINNPFSISTLDLLCDYFEDLQLKPFLREWLGHFRTNMVAFKRKRATEIVEAFKYQKLEQERKKLEQQMLGK